MKKEERKLEELNINHSVYLTRLSERYKNALPYQPPDKTKLVSFIPGTVIELFVKEGDIVKKGAEILVLEAMKMKNRIKSPFNGSVNKVNISVNEKVSKGKILVEIKPDK